MSIVSSRYRLVKPGLGELKLNRNHWLGRSVSAMFTFDQPQLREELTRVNCTWFDVSKSPNQLVHTQFGSGFSSESNWGSEPAFRYWSCDMVGSQNWKEGITFLGVVKPWKREPYGYQALISTRSPTHIQMATQYVYNDSGLVNGWNITVPEYAGWGTYYYSYGPSPYGAPTPQNQLTPVAVSYGPNGVPLAVSQDNRVYKPTTATSYNAANWSALRITKWDIGIDSYHGSYGSGFRGIFYFAAVINRQLSARELLQWTSDPYDMVRPDGRRSYSAAASTVNRRRRLLIAGSK